MEYADYGIHKFEQEQQYEDKKEVLDKKQHKSAPLKSR